MHAQDNPTTPGDANDVAPTLTFHCDFAVQHFAPKLGTSFQTKALLAYLWACVDPWTDKPALFLAASRLRFLFENRRVRSRAISKLVEVGAIKRVGKATPSGSRYVLQRPALHALSTTLREQLTTINARDYRYNASIEFRLDADASPLKKPASVRKPTKVRRKELTEYLHTLSINTGGRLKALTWPIVAYLIEKLCGLSKGSVRYTKSAKDVEAFATWMYLNQVQPAEFMTFWRVLKQARAVKPTGNDLRWVFEDNTPAKSEYLRCVLIDLRPCLQATPGDEQL